MADSDAEQQSETPATGLHCLGGSGPPPQLVEGYRLLLSLPEHAVRALWPLIEAVLQDADADQSQLAQYFAQQHNVDSGRVLGALQTCNLLLRQAAALNVSAEEFQRDLETLSPGSAAPAQLLMPNFRTVVSWLRLKILEDTLADHGKVVTDISWRIEHLQASHRGASLDARIIHLAFQYREGDNRKAVRLQLAPPVAEGLRTLLEQLTDMRREDQ